MLYAKKKTKPQVSTTELISCHVGSFSVFLSPSIVWKSDFCRPSFSPFPNTSIFSAGGSSACPPTSGLTVRPRHLRHVRTEWTNTNHLGTGSSPDFPCSRMFIMTTTIMSALKMRSMTSLYEITGTGEELCGSVFMMMVMYTAMASRVVMQ